MKQDIAMSSSSEALASTMCKHYILGHLRSASRQVLAAHLRSFEVLAALWRLPLGADSGAPFWVQILAEPLRVMYRFL